MRVIILDEGKQNDSLLFFAGPTFLCEIQTKTHYRRRVSVSKIMIMVLSPQLIEPMNRRKKKGKNKVRVTILDEGKK